MGKIFHLKKIHGLTYENQNDTTDSFLSCTCSRFFFMLMDEKNMHFLRGVLHGSTGIWEERFQPTTGIQRVRISSWFRTQKLCRLGGQVTGPMSFFNTHYYSFPGIFQNVTILCPNGVPSDQFEEISKGWYDYYWNPLKALLEKVQ
jgi:hypothetical protein